MNDVKGFGRKLSWPKRGTISNYLEGLKNTIEACAKMASVPSEIRAWPLYQPIRHCIPLIWPFQRYSILALV
jgi:hypothetical protein